MSTRENIRLIASTPYNQCVINKLQLEAVAVYIHSKTAVLV